MTGNLLSSLWRQARTRKDEPALTWNEGGARRVLSWGAYAASVARLASTLRTQGVRPGDKVALYSDNCAEWVISDLGILSVGAVTVPLYPNLTRAQVKYLIEHSEARFAFVRGAARRENLAGLPSLASIVELEKLEAFLSNGSAELGPHEDFAAGLDGSSLSTLVYTSGTTADPKAVMLTHDNLRAQVANLLARHARVPGDRLLSFLPLSHVAERVNALRQLVIGYQVHFCPGTEGVLASLREVRPTRFLGVPRIWEKLEEELKAHRVTSGEEARRWLGLESCASFYSAAAPLGHETLSFFSRLGVPILQGYGMTECAGACHYASEEDPAPGTVGTPLPGVECRLAPDGEIQLRGPSVFAGYYKDESATRAAFVDGWLRTGDLGSRDERGNYRITGRIKDIIVTSAGKNIAPAPLEDALKAHPHVSQAVVIGDGRKYLVALLTLVQGVNRTEAELAISSHIGELNAGWPSYQTIKAWAVLDRDFTLEGGELTPSLKVKRAFVQQKHAALVDELYGKSLARD